MVRFNSANLQRIVEKTVEKKHDESVERMVDRLLGNIGASYHDKAIIKIGKTVERLYVGTKIFTRASTVFSSGAEFQRFTHVASGTNLIRFYPAACNDNPKISREPVIITVAKGRMYLPINGVSYHGDRPSFEFWHYMVHEAAMHSGAKFIITGWKGKVYKFPISVYEDMRDNIVVGEGMMRRTYIQTAIMSRWELK